VRRHVGLVLLTFGLGLIPAPFVHQTRGFYAPDETSYTEVTLEMMHGGDLLVPHLDGRPWFVKPPLVLWLLAGAFSLFGFGFTAAAGLNTVLTLATAWLIGLYAGARGRRAGLLAAMVYLTMMLPALAAGTAITDPALTLLTTAALVVWLRGGRWSASFAGVCLGLGMLAKGPVAPLVVVPALAAAVFAERRAETARRAAVTIGIGAGVVLPWLAVLAQRGVLAQFRAEFLGHQVLSRVVDTWAIAAPWWYYLPVLWIMAFPWGTHLALAPSGWRGDRSRPWHRDPALLAGLAAVLVPLAAFSTAHNKLPHYVLPALPWLAAGVGMALAARWDRRPTRATRVLAATAAAVAAIVLGGTAWSIEHGWVQRYLPGWTSAALAAGAAAMLALGTLELAGRRRAAWFGLAAVGLGVQLVIGMALVPFVVRERVNAAVAAEVHRDLAPDEVPVAYGCERTAFMARGSPPWRQCWNRDELAATIRALHAAGRRALVVCHTDGEGDVRGLAWRAGGEAREVFRTVGLSERVFNVTEVVALEVAAARDGTRWFFDFDRALPGDSGMWGPETSDLIDSFRWAIAKDVRLPIEAADLPGGVLRVQAWAVADQTPPVRLDVRVGGCELGGVELSAAVQGYAFPLAKDCLAVARPVVELRSSRLVRPADVWHDDGDTRPLGAGLDWIAIEPAVPKRVLTPPLPR
jgi:4-amino-4-deoxy-L-arabinose transferase-like glycosyltransferase